MLVKICGLTRQQDVSLAEKMGAHFCGFIFHAKSPRYIHPEQVATLQSGSLQRVGVFVEQDAENILEIMQLARLDFAQLHGKQDVQCALKIGATRVIRVLWPQRYTGQESFLQDLQHYASSSAFYLLDSGLKGGGSGLSFDWKQLQGLKSPRPYFLAGGLDATSVPLVLAQCSPDGLDFNSGLEDAPGQKNPQKMTNALSVLKHLTLKKESKP